MNGHMVAVLTMTIIMLLRHHRFTATPCMICEGGHAACIQSQYCNEEIAIEISDKD